MKGFGRALAAIGAGVGGYVDGTREREEDDHKKLKREQEKEAIEYSKQLRDELAVWFQPEEVAQDGVVPGAVENPGPAGGIDPARAGVAPTGRIPSVDNIRDIYNRYSTLVLTNPIAAEKLKPALDNLRSLGVSEHAKAFQGDINTREGALAYAQHMGAGAGMFGDARSPEDVMKLAELRQKMDSEGYVDALKAAHAGDLSRASKVWNEHGSLKGEVVELRPTTFDLGGQTIQTNAVVYRDDKGKEHVVNAFGGLFNSEAIKTQASLAMQGKENSSQQAARTRQLDQGDRRVTVAEGGLSETKRRNKEAETDADKRLEQTDTQLKETERHNKANEATAALKLTMGEGKEKNLPASKDARSILDTALGITRDPVGRMVNQGDADMDLYADVAKVVDNLVRDGSRPGEAAAIGDKVMKRAIALKKVGSKNVVEKAYKQITEGDKKSKLPDWTR